MKNTNSKRGEFLVIGALIGLVGSVIVSYFAAANDAQIMADQTGREVYPHEMLDGGDVIQAAASTAGGAFLGWGADKLQDDKKDDAPKPPPIQATAGRDNVIILGGDGTSGSNYQSQPTTTTTTPAPAPVVTP